MMNFFFNFLVDFVWVLYTFFLQSNIASSTVKESFFRPAKKKNFSSERVSL